MRDEWDIPHSTDTEIERKKKVLETNETLKAHFQWAFILRVGLFLSLFLQQSNACLSTQASVMRRVQGPQAQLSNVYSQMQVLLRHKTGQLNAASN
jgi:hypothetical protein